MKTNRTNQFLFAVAGLALLTSCASLGKMAKNADDVKYRVSPNPLEVHGDKVALSVNGVFPDKYFAKKVTLEVVPVLKHESGEQAFEKVTVQGEKVAGNNKVIQYKEGGSFSYNDTVAYTPGMNFSELVVRAKGSQGSKSKDFEEFVIGIGVITTPYLLQNDDKAAVAPDGFERVTQHEQTAKINYLVNSSSVRSSELRDADMVELTAFAKEAGKNDAITVKGVSLEAYASPEGELSLNENLADERAQSAQNSVKNILRRSKVADKADGFYKNLPKGEDWLGFKAEMEKTEIEDKDLILRILSMYPDVKKREQEIKNLSKTYVEVADKILPKLRRTHVTVDYEVVGKTDEEILSLAKTNPADLNAQELNYAASLTSDVNEQLNFYQAAEAQFADDFRGANNVGTILLAQGKLTEAKAKFEKANGIDENAYTLTNLGVVARLEGNRTAALEHFEKAGTSLKETAYNKGLVLIQQGKYDAAVTATQAFNTFNSALAATLLKDYDQAKNRLTNSEVAETAMGHYLHAVIAARLGDQAKMGEELTKAITLDAALKGKAQKDREFYSYVETEAFKAAVK